MLTRSDYLRIALLIVFIILIPNFNASITPMMTADMAVKQLEDSDAWYTGFKAMKYVPTLLWVFLGIYFVFVVYKVFNKK